VLSFHERDQDYQNRRCGQAEEPEHEFQGKILQGDANLMHGNNSGESLSSSGFQMGFRDIQPILGDCRMSYTERLENKRYWAIADRSRSGKLGLGQPILPAVLSGYSSSAFVSFTVPLV